MTNRDFADKDLRCASCGDSFVLSAGEQELFQVRGVTAEPERCPICIRGRGHASTHMLTADRSSA